MFGSFCSRLFLEHVVRGAKGPTVASLDAIYDAKIARDLSRDWARVPAAAQRARGIPRPFGDRECACRGAGGQGFGELLRRRIAIGAAWAKCRGSSEVRQHDETV